MGQSTKDNGNRMQHGDRENLSIIEGMSILARGLIIELMGLENLPIFIIKAIKGNGSLISLMEKENRLGEMEVVMRDIMIKERNRVGVRILWLMVIYTRVIGRTINIMVKGGYR